MLFEYFIYCHYFVSRAVDDIYVDGVTRYIYKNATEWFQILSVLYMIYGLGGKTTYGTIEFLNKLFCNSLYIQTILAGIPIGFLVSYIFI